MLKAQKPRNPAYPARLETIGDHLRTKRLDEGKYLREVAKEIGVAKETLHDWELNKSKPIIYSYPGILRYLGYDPFFQNPEVPGEQLRHYRRVHGLTQSDLADHLGVNVHTIGRVERNSGNYSKTEERVAEFLEGLTSPPPLN